ncbi:MAG: peptidase M20 [Planctomycetaceae bacterium]|jgi:tripeptide aminopeptidase|nr:peptidase M20 [Planctomycetaceae bacterium]MDP7275428.1 M20/M25/M40 family metallo-hydrolase [Planctomycetaceae bacterium]
MPTPSVPHSIDSSAAVDLVTELMAIPGKSGEEAQVAAAITGKLRKAGIPAAAISHDGANRRSPAGGQVGNLIVKLPGSQRAPRRLLMAHVDTVPLCVGCRPVRRGAFIQSRDKTTGLGGDDRAGACVVLTAVLEIFRQELPHPPLTLFFPVQEEIGLYGARFVSISKLGRPAMGFNWDGGDPGLAVLGATGDYSIDVTIDGIASHAGGHPEEGVNAIAVASLAIADLTRNGWHGLIEKGRQRGTSNVGIVNGGDATNVVTPHLRLKAEARSHDPKFRRKIVNAFERAFRQAAGQLRNTAGKTARITFEATLKYESFVMSENEPCVQTALAAVESIGRESGIRISNGGLDANWMFDHGIPTVTLGCGQQDIHTVNESLHVESYLQACRIGLQLATGTT